MRMLEDVYTLIGARCDELEFRPATFRHVQLANETEEVSKAQTSKHGPVHLPQNLQHLGLEKTIEGVREWKYVYI